MDESIKIDPYYLSTVDRPTFTHALVDPGSQEMEPLKIKDGALVLHIDGLKELTEAINELVAALNK